MSARRYAFTLIELLVVVAIIALLVSILLPSLGQARQQAKASVCASRLRSWGQGVAFYHEQYGSFAPQDDYPMFIQRSDPSTPSGASGPGRRQTASIFEVLDPAIGWYALFGLNITPHIPATSDPLDKLWGDDAWGFYIQGVTARETLWEGFFCPAQNLRNTTDPTTPEQDITSRHRGAGQAFPYAAGYAYNRLLRSACPLHSSQPSRFGGEQPFRILPANANLNAQAPVRDNAYTTPRAVVDGDEYHIQANVMEELTQPADCLVFADSLDFFLTNSTNIAGGNNNWAAGDQFVFGTGAEILPLGSRHLDKANVLFADGHVTRDDQEPRNRRGDDVVASTFSERVDGVGNQHKIMPEWRMFRKD